MGRSNSNFSRRKFIGTSLGAVVSAGIAGVIPRSALAEGTEETARAAGEIQYRTLGRTGLKLPIVSMGAGAASDPGIVKASYELGVRHFDTASAYQFGRNEQMVATAINRMGVRDKVAIGTKALTSTQRRGATPEQLRKRLIKTADASLRRLKTDYLDILYVHDVQDVAPIKDEAIIDGMKQLKSEGKVRFTGISTHSDMANVINAVTEGGFYDVVLTSLNFTMADDTALLGAIKKAAEKGVGVVAMKTQAGGTNFPNPQSRQEFTNSTIATAALKWVMRNKNITTSIPGFSNYEFMREDFSVATNLEYTELEKKFLSDNNIRMSIGFCRQCRQCLASCPNDADIPNMMRTHMYAAQYSDFQLARATIDDIPAVNGLNNCVSCAECTANCANTVDIARRIEELKLIYA